MTQFDVRKSHCSIDWQKLFGMGSAPTSNSADYPSIQELKETLHHRREELTSWFKSMSEEQLVSRLPEDKSGFAKTYAGFMAFIACHECMHAGQISTIRASLGITPMIK